MKSNIKNSVPLPNMYICIFFFVKSISKQFSGLFLATSMINHDCVPNARIVFDQEGHLNLKAKKPISQGESITITYVPALLNTPARLSKLKNSKFFICKCQLCCDPTENGTFMSALVCPKCQVCSDGNGYI